MKCPVCLFKFESADYGEMAAHFLNEPLKSDNDHKGWIGRYASESHSQPELSRNLSSLFDNGGDLKGWIVRRLIERIYGEPVHPFILRLQHPDSKTIYGYVMEHHHFLAQWVRSCAAIIYKCDAEDVQLYEIDNIVSEFGGESEEKPSHHELLLRMGESIGIDRKTVYSTEPLHATADAIRWWRKIADECHWVETMAAMHTLELTANPDIKEMGSKLTYFDPAILEGREISDEVKRFLYEGYKADAGHSMEALDLIEKYSAGTEHELDVESAVFKTVDLLDRYLSARLQRGESYGD